MASNVVRGTRPAHTMFDGDTVFVLGTGVTLEFFVDKLCELR